MFQSASLEAIEFTMSPILASIKASYGVPLVVDAVPDKSSIITGSRPNFSEVIPTCYF